MILQISPMIHPSSSSCRKIFTALPFQPLYSSPAAWTAAEMRARTDEWTYHLIATDIAELHCAAQAALDSNKPLHTILSKDDFPLPTLGPKLDGLRKEASFGRGFALIRGVPVTKWSRQLTVAAYWLCGLHWGKALSNNKKGHLIGHITDIGLDPLKPETRLYATAAPQPFHNDAADIVSLLCLSTAEEGGVSHWSSSISGVSAN